MAAFNKFNCFVGDIGLKLHNLNTDVLKIYLTNTAPVATNTVFGTPAEITAGNGYVAGGLAVTNAYSQTGGVGTLTGSSVTWTASGGAIATFRYAVLYNFTAVAQNLIGWWDYGVAVTLNATEPFSVTIGANILTLQ